jgi:hypothetical protein
VPVVRNHRRQSKSDREQIQGTLLGEVIAELDPTSSVEYRSIEATFATAKQPHAVFIGRVHSRSETVFVLRALALAVYPRLDLRFTA